MKKPIIKERGWAGHFIGAFDCRYRRNTLVSNSKKHIIVSSVGNYVNSNGKSDTIGRNRYYETMVFFGYEDAGYVETNVHKQVDFGDLDWGLWGEDGIEDFEQKHPNADNEMDIIHDNIVQYIFKNFGDIKCNEEI